MIRIEVSRNTAVVTVSPTWLAQTQGNAQKLIDVLRERGVERAIVMTDDGRPLGGLDIVAGRALLVGVPPKPK